MAQARLGLADRPRPPGPLIWLHVKPDEEPESLLALTEHIESEMPGTHYLVTGAEQDIGAPFMCRPLPADAPQTAERFFEQWKPDAGLWLGAPDHYTLLDGAVRAGLPLFLADAQAPSQAQGRMLRRTRAFYRAFDEILALSKEAGEAIRAVDIGATRLRVTGPLAALKPPLGHTESDREELAEAQGTRPSWCAALAHASETDALMEAHRIARRGAHRLLLYLVPSRPSDAGAIADRLRTSGWSVAFRSDDDPLIDEVDVYIGDVPRELGLWYRLSPVSFLGGSLSEASPAANPLEGAALGSALIIGPHSAPHEAAVGQLLRNGAARPVDGTEALGAAVAELLAPDRAALLAHNAWALASDGAQGIETLSHLLVEAVGRANVSAAGHA